MNTTEMQTSHSCGWVASTLGRKEIIGVTGLGLCGFLLTHMAANLLIIISPQAYNEYSHALITNPFIYAAEAGLLVLFLAHLLTASLISIANLKARGSRYVHRSNGEKGTSLIRRTLWPQGLLILVFLILHLITFKFGNVYSVNYGKGEIRDLHKLVIEVFHNPIYVSWYIVALIVLLMHLSHGFASSLQTLGIHHPRYQPAIKAAGWGYALIVSLGFIVQPLYVFLLHKG